MSLEVWSALLNDDHQTDSNLLHCSPSVDADGDRYTHRRELRQAVRLSSPLDGDRLGSDADADVCSPDVDCGRGDAGSGF